MSLSRAVYSLNAVAILDDFQQRSGSDTAVSHFALLLKLKVDTYPPCTTSDHHFSYRPASPESRPHCETASPQRDKNNTQHIRHISPTASFDTPAILAALPSPACQYSMITLFAKK